MPRNNPYGRLSRTVGRIVRRYGKPGVLIHTAQGGYNPATGTVEPGEETRHLIRAVEIGYELEHIPGTLIEAGNKVGFFMFHEGIAPPTPVVQMRIQLDGDTPRALRELQPVSPGATTLYWKFVAGN